MLEFVVFLVLAFAPIYVVWRLTQAVTGDFMRPITRLVRTMLRRIGAAVWTNPMRRHGFLKTLWLWLVGFAAGLSVCCLGILPITPAGAVGLGGVVICVWAVVVLGWWIMRWWARRRYTPRPLHTRRRRR